MFAVVLIEHLLKNTVATRTSATRFGLFSDGIHRRELLLDDGFGDGAFANAHAAANERIRIGHDAQVRN